VLQNFYKICLGYGVLLAKTTFSTKIGGGWASGASKNFLDPLRISATVEASNFKFGIQLGFGTSLAKTTFRTILAGVWARRASRKIWDPLRISATVKASNFGTQIGFGASLPKNDV